MSAYVDEFQKLAQQSAQQKPTMGQHLLNAAIVAGGVGAGVGVGTLAAHALKERVPDTLKSPWLPAGIGLSAGALKLLLDLREDEKRNRLQGAQ